jgi:hypothetical protein
MEPKVEQMRDPVSDIVASTRGEQQLLRQLRIALEQQRKGVADSDPERIELASRAVANTVLTLDAARRRREDLLRLVAAGKPIRLEALENHVGPVDGLAEARLALRNEAEGAIRDLALTQQVLQGAMQAGNAYLQALFSSVVPESTSYAADGRAPQAAVAAGNLVNRSA